jgi:two-component system OmpR family sensor kinase
MKGSSPTDRLLRRLRRRLTATLGAVAGVAIIGFIAVLVLASTTAARRQLDTTLRGQASRAAALVFLDEDGRPDVSGLRDDAVLAEVDEVVVFGVDAENRLVPVLSADSVSTASLSDLARRELDDEDDGGSLGWTTLDGERVRAAAMPWYQGQKIMGAAIAVHRLPTLDHDPVFAPAVAGGAAVLLLLLVTGWLLVGRSLRPAAEALADRERFLATAAHELRLPLARLRAGAEVARRATSSGDPSRLALNRLLTMADSAGQVVANLLLASRIDHSEQPARHEEVRLDQLVADLEHSVGNLVVDIREPVVVTGDRGLLRHAVTNLIDNSIRHGRVGDETPTVTVAVLRRHSTAVIQVRDDGPGFPPGIDVLARYVTGARGGTGLGLPLVLWIAEQHGGTVRLQNGTAAEPGAMVEITLPSAAPGAASSPPASPS